MIIKEWQALIKKYGVDSFAVYDSNFFVDEKEPGSLLWIIKKASHKVGQR